MKTKQNLLRLELNLIFTVFEFCIIEIQSACNKYSTCKFTNSGVIESYQYRYICSMNECTMYL